MAVKLLQLNFLYTYYYMKKTLLLTAALFAMLFTSNFANAAGDEESHFGIGITGGLPLETGYTAVVGADFKYEHFLQENLFLTGRIGFNYIPGKTMDFFGYSFSYSAYQIPFLIGAKYFFAEKIYGSAEIGGVHSSVKVNLFGLSATASTNGFGFAVGGGYKISENIDLGLHYAGYDGFGQLLVRGGYKF